MSRIFENYNVASTRIKRDELSKKTLQTIVKNNQGDILFYEHGKNIFERQWQQMVQNVFIE